MSEGYRRRRLNRRTRDALKIKHPDWPNAVRWWELGFRSHHRWRDAMKRELGRIHGYRCMMCDLPFRRRELTLDHIRAIARGGDDKIENLQLLCEPCNQTKGQTTWSGIP